MNAGSAHNPGEAIRQRKVWLAVVLTCLSAIIGVVVNVSVSAGVPDLISPFPFFVIAPYFWGVPMSIITLVAVAVFAIPQLSDLSETSNSEKRIGLSALLFLFTGLTAVWLIGGWSYGQQYQGGRYTQGVLLENIIVGAIAWSTWYRSRPPDRFYMRLLFAFILSIWVFWCGLPYLGELP